MGENMTYKYLLVEVKDRVVTITLNRTEAGNAFHVPFAKELFEVALEFSHNTNVNAVVIQGSGKAFSFGGDLKSFSEEGTKIDLNLKEVTTYLHNAISLFVRMKKVVIASVNGTAAGAGLSLLCSCDIVISGASAKYTSAYTKVGLTPDGSCTYFLPRLIGLRKTQELLYTNRVLSSNEAAEWGIVTRVVDDSELRYITHEFAKEIAGGPTNAYAMTKKLLNNSFLDRLDSHMAMESDMISEMTVTKDGKEGIAAFLEKRSPDFV